MILDCIEVSQRTWKRIDIVFITYFFKKFFSNLTDVCSSGGLANPLSEVSEEDSSLSASFPFSFEVLLGLFEVLNKQYKIIQAFHGK